MAGVVNHYLRTDEYRLETLFLPHLVPVLIGCILCRKLYCGVGHGEAGQHLQNLLFVPERLLHIAHQRLVGLCERLKSLFAQQSGQQVGGSLAVGPYLESYLGIFHNCGQNYDKKL